METAVCFLFFVYGVYHMTAKFYMDCKTRFTLYCNDFMTKEY